MQVLEQPPNLGSRKAGWDRDACQALILVMLVQTCRVKTEVVCLAVRSSFVGNLMSTLQYGLTPGLPSLESEPILGRVAWLVAKVGACSLLHSLGGARVFYGRILVWIR